MLCHCNLMKPSRFILLFSLKSCFIYSSKGDSYIHTVHVALYMYLEGDSYTTCNTCSHG